MAKKMALPQGLGHLFSAFVAESLGYQRNLREILIDDITRGHRNSEGIIPFDVVGGIADLEPPFFREGELEVIVPEGLVLLLDGLGGAG